MKLFQELGGEIRFNSEIARIVTRDGVVTGLQTNTGREERFDLVVSNADVVHTYDWLLKDEPRAAATARQLGKKKYSMSLFLIYFGTKRKYPNLQHHNVIFGPRYRELLGDIFERGRLADDFSLYLHAPTRSDPTLAPPGCDAFYVLSPVPHLGKLAIDWKVEGPALRGKDFKVFGAALHAWVSTASIVTQRIFTPADFKSELNAHLGSAFSLEPRLMQSAYFRVHNRDRNIRGLYFVGAGTHPGAGIPGVVNSGKATANLILEDHEIRIGKIGCQNDGSVLCLMR